MTVGNTSNISRRNYTKPGKTCGCLEWLCREVQISSCRYSKRSNHDVLVDLWKHHWQHPHCSTCIFLNSPSSIYIKHRTRLHFRAVPKLANSWQAFFVVFFFILQEFSSMCYFPSPKMTNTQPELCFNILWLWKIYWQYSTQFWYWLENLWWRRQHGNILPIT